MFTGIVQDMGTIRSISRSKESLRIAIAANSVIMDNTAVGDSISVSGVCLTVVDLVDDEFQVDVSRETIECSTFGEIRSGDSVNIEPSLTLEQSLGGHLVGGHVDTVAVCTASEADGSSNRLTFELTDQYGPYIARKGSIAVDGVSLTVNEVHEVDDKILFEVNIIPHTLQSTTLGSIHVGDRVHVEVDLIARYVERMIRFATDRNIIED